MRMNASNPKPRKKRIGFGFVLMLILLIILVIGGFYFLDIASKINHNEIEKEDLGIAQPVTDNPNDKSITNIALFGVDQRGDQTQVHSDVVMVLSVDKAHNKIKLSSLMRDMAVEIDEYGQNKLTQAYFSGGPTLAIKTINQNFSLNIEEYVTVNFQQMATIVDAVGGVEIDISESERINANQSIYEQAATANLPPKEIEKAGLQTLNGTQAVAYARIRKVGNADFERTDRQRKVIEQLFNKALTMNKLRYPEFAKKLLPAVETSLDIGEILNLSTIMLREITFEDIRFPTNAELIGNGQIYIGNSQCLNVDIEMMSDDLKKFIYDDIIPE